MVVSLQELWPKVPGGRPLHLALLARETISTNGGKKAGDKMAE